MEMLQSGLSQYAGGAAFMPAALVMRPGTLRDAIHACLS